MSTSYADFSKYAALVNKFPRRKRALTIGDSWFQYPLRRYGDIQRKIDTRFAANLLCLDDSDPGRDADEAVRFMPRWTRLAGALANDLGKPFDLLLVSLGGNDVIGQDFARHLKRPDEPAEGTRWDWNGDMPEVVRMHIKLNPLG